VERDKSPSSSFQRSSTPRTTSSNATLAGPETPRKWIVADRFEHRRREVRRAVAARARACLIGNDQDISLRYTRAEQRLDRSEGRARASTWLPASGG